MESIDVFLDTSVLPRTPSRLGLGFESLAQLAQSSLIRVYLSEIVKDEWKSQLIDDWENMIGAVEESLRALNRHPWARRTSDFINLLSASGVLPMLPMQKYLIVDQAFDELLGELQAQILPINDNDAQDVFRRYFGGFPPFGSPKNRNDIPDAFIYISALELAQGLQGNLHCVIGDKRLRDSLEVVETIIVYTSLEELVRTDLVKKLSTKLEPEKKWRAVFRSLMKSLPSREARFIQELNSLLVDDLSSVSIQHDVIPDENGEALITLVDEAQETKFYWNEVIEFGPNLLELPFSTSLSVTLEFLVYRGDVLNVPSGVSVSLRDEVGGHYFEAEGTVWLEVTGSLALHFDPSSLDNNQIPQLSRVGIQELSSIEIEENSNGEIFQEVENYLIVKNIDD